MLDMLCFDEQNGYVIKNLSIIIGFCLVNPDGEITNRREYVFRANTKGYAYLSLCTPNEKDTHAYVYPDCRELLDRHM